ncbi:MAG TPA: hypothetical protein PLM16_02930, partial [Candidatus Woesebacteria bacterium]|nr:hypothetical protein [Candidatus Woesebacteria bacterium]
MGRPVLINAVSNAQARDLYQALKSAGYNQIQLVVSTEADLNAQERMAYAQAGRSGTITIVAKLAGRGVDIKLGGDPILTAQIKIAEKESAGIKLSASEKETIIEKCQNECLADAQRARNAGGLHVIGVEHGRGRDDRQLMGRAARQGDPGSSQFYYSPDDQWALEHSVQRELDQAHHRWWERLVRRVFLSEKRRQARQEATHDRVIARIQKDVEL